MFLIKETPPSERPQLFIKKLHQCRVLFDFNDPNAEIKGKQIKAQTLHDLLEYITQQRGIITENLYPEVVNMVCTLFRFVTAMTHHNTVRDQSIPLHPPSC